MARARNIKPDFFKNDALADLPFEHRLLFIGLWTMADREGRLEYRPKRIKMEIFPGDSVDVESGLSALVAAGFLCVYECNQLKIIQVVNFTKHQSPHGLEKDSELPDENGFYTIHERKPNGCSTGKKQLSKTLKQFDNNIDTIQAQDESQIETVLTKDKNSSETVLKQNRNALIVDCGLLIPDSLIPEKKAVGDDFEKKSPPQKTKGTRLPEDWQPTAGDVDFCRSERPDLDCQRTADEFRDYWTSKTGVGATKLDWSKTWRNWVRNQRHRQPQNTPKPSRHNGIQHTNWNEGIDDDGKF